MHIVRFQICDIAVPLCHLADHTDTDDTSVKYICCRRVASITITVKEKGRPDSTSGLLMVAALVLGIMRFFSHQTRDTSSSISSHMSVSPVNYHLLIESQMFTI